MFGESALDEMCFVIGYYYPSTGVDVCVDGMCEYRTATDAGAGDAGGVDAGAGDAPTADGAADAGKD